MQELSQPVPKSKGVVVTGGVGFGKTAIVEQLVEYSPFGSGHGGLVEECGEVFLRTYGVTVLYSGWVFLSAKFGSCDK